MNTLNETKDRMKIIETAKHVNNSDITKLDGEYKCIMRISAKIAVFVANTATLSHCAAIPEYYKNEIQSIEDYLPATREQSTRDALVRKLNNLKVAVDFYAFSYSLNSLKEHFQILNIKHSRSINCRYTYYTFKIERSI